MATTKQTQGVKRNVQKAAAPNRSTRSPMCRPRPGGLWASRGRLSRHATGHGRPAPEERQELYDGARRRIVAGRSKMGSPGPLGQLAAQARSPRPIADSAACLEKLRPGRAVRSEADEPVVELVVEPGGLEESAGVFGVSDELAMGEGVAHEVPGCRAAGEFERAVREHNEREPRRRARRAPPSRLTGRRCDGVPPADG